MFNRNIVLGLLVALGISGYPLLAALMSLANADESRLPSIVLRLGVAILGLLALWLNRKSLRVYHPVFLACFALFWAMYVFRVISDSYLQQISMAFEPVEVITMIVTFVLLPTLPMLVGLNPWSTKWAFWLLAIFSAMTLGLVALQLEDLAALIRDAGANRFRLERLNPISVGYVGATMLVLSAVGVFRPTRSINLLTRGMFALAGGIGLFFVIVAASRGPAIAAAVTLLAYAMVPFRASRMTIGAIGLGGIAFAVMAIRSIAYRLFEFDVFTRFIDAAEGYDASTAAREDSYAGAWQQFVENPLFGDALIERTTGSYPHNLVLESLMATGLLGGLAYIAMLLMLLLAAVRLLNREEGYEWLALLGILFGVSGAFSGAHFTSDVHWLTLTAVIVTEMKLRPGAQLRQIQRRQRSAEIEARADTFVTPRNLVEKELMQGEPVDQSGQVAERS